MEKYKKEELELVKNYIKKNYCDNWYELHSLGKVIFEEFITDGVCFLKIKNKCFLINNINEYSDSTIICIDIKEVKNLKINVYKRFKIDWVINILAKNDRVVEYLYDEI